jgi:hypothetical protein
MSRDGAFAVEPRGGNRQGDHRPQLSDLRESGSIEQDADVVAFIFREEVYQPKTRPAGLAELIVGKQRNGPVGTVNLVFLHAQTKFENRLRRSREVDHSCSDRVATSRNRTWNSGKPLSTNHHPRR